MKIDLNIKPGHILEAEKMADVIWGKCPVHQQEMKEAIAERLIALTSVHLHKLKK